MVAHISVEARFIKAMALSHFLSAGKLLLTALVSRVLSCHF
jgi:hypothetical protein